MTWVQHCDGPACTDQALLTPLTLFAPDETEMHFCSQECLLRWSARIPAEIAAVEQKGDR